MSEFEQNIHSMFDHIWECEIDHPCFQDTVGELMTAVIQCYENLSSAQSTQINAELTQDCVIRQAVIDAMCKVGCGSVYCGISCDEVKAIEQLPSAQPDNQVHLCDSCRYVYPACPSGKDDVIFGNGKGNDNICACNKYEPSEQPKIIRCKDCTNWDTTWTNDWTPNYHYCPIIDGVRKDDFYCADAERRTDA